MKPKYHGAVVDLVLHYDWRSIIYIFQSSEGLYRLQKIYENIPKVCFTILCILHPNSFSHMEKLKHR